ncbi:MAG: hypothetical protein HQK52_01030 [Oligoflexia bacterium]|nr:hypothetical protein [Oligoflexia bacterium]
MLSKNNVKFYSTIALIYAVVVVFIFMSWAYIDFQQQQEEIVSTIKQSIDFAKQDNSYLKEQKAIISSLLVESNLSAEEILGRWLFNRPIPHALILVDKKNNFFASEYTTPVSMQLKLNLMNNQSTILKINDVLEKISNEREIVLKDEIFYGAETIGQIISFIDIDRLKFNDAIPISMRKLFSTDVSSCMKTIIVLGNGINLCNKNSFSMYAIYFLLHKIVYIIVFLFLGLMGLYYILKFQDERSKMYIIQSIGQQVSHDIRSPLTALISSARTWIHLLPEEERITVRSQIQRIQDIANDLLKRRKEIQSGKTSLDAISISPQMLSSCIEEIVTEKRMNFRQFLDLHIEAITDQTYGIFANINLTEFKRLLSNLINNATESYDDKKGRVEISLSQDDLNAVITVKDFGKGIPIEILAKLGVVGVTHGKDGSKNSGNGLGVAHAKKTVESWGGQFKIDSVIGMGTSVQLIIPKATAPHWFVSKISIEEYSAIVILDDDQGIHQTWDKRLSLLGDKDKFTVVHVSTPDAFSAWIAEYSLKYVKILYLCDYELLGHEFTGLKLIEQHNLKMAYLVTSHYEENKIRAKCQELGIKLIPKMLAGLIPIEFNAAKITGAIQSEAADLKNVQAVYVDDEFYNRKDWIKHAKKRGVHLLALETSAELIDIYDQLDKDNCEIFLDRELGIGLPKGEEVATQLHKKGFKKIALATGYDPDVFTHIPWLKVLGKDCPWSDEKDAW